MNQSLVAQLESAPYDAATAVSLEAYVNSQITEKSYDYAANKALLKNYQVNTSSVKPEFVGKVLILSLMRLPSSDFISLTYLIPTSLNGNANIVTIQKCADSLERGKFREFWELFVSSNDLFGEVNGFVDSIRLFIVSNLRDTFKNIPKVLFQEQLGLDEATVGPFCQSNKFIEKVAGDVIELAANEENQRKTVRGDEGTRIDEVGWHIRSCF
jgi:hypothetical protein